MQEDTVEITIRIPRALSEKTEQRATQDGVKTREVIISALREYLGGSDHLDRDLRFGIPRSTKKE
jgi:hypothetical protein